MLGLIDLKVWKAGIELLREVYELTKKFPADEQYGLTKQLRSSAKSILGNLSEGFGRFTFADKANKYIIARGECVETAGHLHVAVALGYVTQEQAARAIFLTDQVGRMLSGLIRNCRESSLLIPNL